MWLTVPLAKKPGWWSVSKGIQVAKFLLVIVLTHFDMNGLQHFAHKLQQNSILSVSKGTSFSFCSTSCNHLILSNLYKQHGVWNICQVGAFLHSPCSAGHLRMKWISSSTSPLHIVHILSKRGIFGLLYLPNSSINQWWNEDFQTCTDWRTIIMIILFEWDIHCTTADTDLRLTK